MGIQQNSQNKKDLNVELNLLPVFDILSVCICFLLMTVVWVEVRAMETKQAIGGQSQSETAKDSSLWISIDTGNNLTVEFKNMGRNSMPSKTVYSLNREINFDHARKVLAQASAANIKSLHILPSPTTKYNQVIRLMDLSRQSGIANIGLSPI